MDPRTPVIVGVGQVLQRLDDPAEAREPVALMVEAVGGAARDAGLASVPEPDALWVVNLLSWNYGNPARFVADDLGFSSMPDSRLGLSAMGGNTPQTLVNKAARSIVSGEADTIFLTGGETSRSRHRARAAGMPWKWRTTDAPPTVVTAEMDMVSAEEARRGIYMPVQVYPMFETAIRAAAGRSVEEHQKRISELYARFSAVAVDNPFAWDRVRHDAEEIRTVGPRNRMIGLPYPKMMNSNNQVDMAAAILVCSAERAASLGVPRDRWVFPLSGTDTHEHPWISERFRYDETPAVRIGGRRALELAGIGIDDVSVVDLYSCFPSAVQLGAASLGLDIGSQLTRTGGLQFGGGPWNNYVMHAIATVVADLRERPGEHGLVWANGGFATKHAIGVYGTVPPAAGFRHDSPQDEIDALPRRELASTDDAAGPAIVEAYTVMFDRDGHPERTIAACLLADGRRAWGTSEVLDTARSMCEGEWVGREVRLGSDGELST
jgi:acetyl-CoA C-acetyltransferase